MHSDKDRPECSMERLNYTSYILYSFDFKTLHKGRKTLRILLEALFDRKIILGMTRTDRQYLAIVQKNLQKIL